MRRNACTVVVLAGPAPGRRIILIRVADAGPAGGDNRLYWRSHITAI
jgi:hypothetical protein